MPRLKLATILEKKVNKEYVCFSDLPQTAYCPECKEVAQKIKTSNSYISGTGFAYICKECDFSKERTI